MSRNCSICSELSGYYCNGCKQYLCQSHGDEHRQSLYNQLDWLTVDHEDLRATLDNSSSIEQISFPLKRIIDKWEDDSIKHIQNTANQARRQLNVAIDNHLDDIRQKLKELTDEFNSINENHKILFDERNLKQWANELHKLKHEFLTTPSFTVRVHGNKPVVMPIIKIQPETVNQTSSNPPPQSPLENPIGLTLVNKNLNSQISMDKNKDRFDLVSNHIQILDSGRLFLHDATKSDGSVCGLNEYSHGKHQLYFRIENLPSTNPWIFFGIISKHASFNPCVYKNSTAYGWTGYNRVYISGKPMAVQNGLVNDMKTNDIIELIIDCDEKTICFWHSRQAYKIKLSIDNQICPFPWTFLISCRNSHDFVRILPPSLSSTFKYEQDKLDKNMKIKEINIKSDNNNTTETL